MTYDILEVERQLRADPEGAVAHWEAAYDAQVRSVAAAITQNRDKSPVVLLAGPSGSSKTTTAARICRELQQMGLGAHLISMDNYYLARSHPDYPMLPDGSPDLESPYCLDIALLEEHFGILETGGDIYVPIYDFPTHSRLESRSLRMDASQGDVFIFEGIHALNDLFTGKHPDAYGVFVSPEDSFSREGQCFCTPESLRLMRRIVRDYLFRGAAARYSLELWGNVLDGEQRYILPFRSRAQAVITTTLPYEIGVMKRYVEPLLLDLPKDVPCRESVDTVLALLPQVAVLPETLVPGNSILREFIGGGQ